jgi:hypothetical protein
MALDEETAAGVPLGSEDEGVWVTEVAMEGAPVDRICALLGFEDNPIVGRDSGTELVGGMFTPNPAGTVPTQPVMLATQTWFRQYAAGLQQPAEAPHPKLPSATQLGLVSG